jgi:hypothetical protein
MKLVHNYDTGKYMLYDIAKDRAERNDVSAEQAEAVKSMQAKLDAYLQAVKAQMPVVNPNAGKDDGGAPTDGGKPKGGKGGGGGGGKGGGKGGGGKGGQGGGGQGGGQGGGLGGNKDANKEGSSNGN